MTTHRQVAVIAAISCLLTQVGLAQADSPIPISLVLQNGNIVTQDKENPTVQAMAVFKDRILATGDSATIKALAQEDTCVIDLQGRTVIPGLADGHVHSKALRYGLDAADLVPARNIADIVAAIAEKTEQVPEGTLIRTTADWHESQLEELRLPTRWDIDPVSPNHPVVLIRGGHTYILNTKALDYFGIDETTEAPPGGHIGRDPETSEITGELVDRAKDLAPLPKIELDQEERLELLKEEHARWNELGLTSVRNPGVQVEEFHDYVELARRGEMTIRNSIMIRWDRKTPAEAYREELEAWPLLSGFGDEWIQLDGIKLGVDGGYEGGWMTEAYEEPLGQGGTYFGLNTVPRPLFMEIVEMVHEVGLRAATHAVGDAAVELVLDAYEMADQMGDIGARRWTIEHAFITRDDQIERIADMDIILSAQSHLYLAGNSLIKYWGLERAAMVAPTRDWIDAGIIIAGGTDNKLPYVPEDPITTFYHWVTRDTVSAGRLGEDQAISRGKALRAATINNAYTTFEEDVKGSLEPGKYADLVVLSQNLLTVPEDEIRATKVLGTMVGGEWVHTTESLGAGCAVRKK